MKQIFIIASIITASILLNACHEAKSTQNTTSTEKIPVKIVALNQHLAQQSIHTSGQFTTEDETYLSFRIGGIINQVFVKEGDKVHKGQLVATLHLNEINAQVQQAKYNYEKALRDYNRYSTLYKDSVITLEHLQNTKTALDVSQEQLKAIHFNQNYSEIRATSNGFVLKKIVNAGQTVNAGDPIVQINGAHQSAWVLKAYVSDLEWGAIKIGNSAIIQTDALPNRTIQAVVSGKAAGINPSTGTFSIDLQLKSGEFTSIASGLFGKAIIYPSVKNAVWTVPCDALMDGEAGEAYVFITNDYKTALKVKVKVNNIDKGTAIISSGLETAKALIINGSAYLVDGSTIKITQ